MHTGLALLVGNTDWGLGAAEEILKSSRNKSLKTPIAMLVVPKDTGTTCLANKISEDYAVPLILVNLGVSGTNGYATILENNPELVVCQCEWPGYIAGIQNKVFAICLGPPPAVGQLVPRGASLQMLTLKAYAAREAACSEVSICAVDKKTGRTESCISSIPVPIASNGTDNAYTLAARAIHAVSNETVLGTIDEIVQGARAHHLA